MSDKFKHVYGEFWSFIRNPSKDLLERISIIEKLQVFIPLILLELLLTIFLGGLIAGLGNQNSTSFSNVKLQLGLKYTPVWFIFIVMTVITPIIEEVFFRLSLRFKEKYMYLNVTILITGLILLLLFFFKVFHFQIAAISIGIILLVFYFLKKNRFNSFILTIWDRNFFYVFYISVLVYGLLHLTNLNHAVTSLLLLPILILPQLILGLFCGYIRLKLGFSWGCIFHSLHNFIFIIPMLVINMIPVSHNNSIEIIEQTKTDVFSNWRITRDTIEFERLKISDILPKLLGLDKEYIEYEDPCIENKILTVNFARGGRELSEKPRSSENFIIAELLRKYNLKIERNLIDRENYQIQIVDSVKLILHNRYNKDTIMTKNFTIFYDNEIILYYADLDLIARTIGQNYNKKVFYSLNNHNKYTITIPKLEFEELNQFMTDQYGITLKKSISKVSVYKVKSVN